LGLMMHSPISIFISAGKLQDDQQSYGVMVLFLTAYSNCLNLWRHCECQSQILQTHFWTNRHYASPATWNTTLHAWELQWRGQVFDDNHRTSHHQWRVVTRVTASKQQVLRTYY
jgi:hypothetical protein